MKQPIGACIIVFKNNAILLGKRKNAYLAGSYGMPGGRVELGESLVTTAERELLEETGLTAKELTYIGCVREFQGEKDFIHFAYICKDFIGELTLVEPDKCEGWEWIHLDELQTIDILPGHKGIIEMWQKEEIVKDIFANN